MKAPVFQRVVEEKFIIQRATDLAKDLVFGVGRIGYGRTLRFNKGLRLD